MAIVDVIGLETDSGFDHGLNCPYVAA